jgi:heat shock protein HslJ
MTMKKLSLAAFLCATTLFFACTDDGSGNLIISQQWKVAKLDAEDATPYKASLNISVPNKKMGGTSGCNTFGGDVTADTIKQSIDFGPVITTKIGCANPLATFEQNYYNTLSVIDGYIFDGENAYLTEKGKQRILLTK